MTDLQCRQVMHEFLLHPNGITYPVTDLIIGCGFLLTLMIEKVVMRLNKRRNQVNSLSRFFYLFTCAGTLHIYRHAFSALQYVL